MYLSIVKIRRTGHKVPNQYRYLNSRGLTHIVSLTTSHILSSENRVLRLIGRPTGIFGTLNFQIGAFIFKEEICQP